MLNRESIDYIVGMITGVSLMVIFWDGKSKGTLNTIDKAKKMNIIVQVITDK
jgi:hypothetical protein